MQKFKWLLMVTVLAILLAGGAGMITRTRAASGEDTLYPGQTLTSGQYLRSQNGLYTLAMQSDGNLVEYDSSGHPMWASGTWGHPDTILFNQSDGNMVLVAPGNNPIWSTNTSGHPGGTVFTLQNDANVVVYAPGHAAVWASHNGNSITDMINQIFGADGPAAKQVAMCESGLHPNAYNPASIGGSHAEGLFQILYPSTWKTTSQASHSPYDAQANILAAHEIFIRDGHSWREWVCQP